MKTTLPKSISTAPAARVFLKELHANGEHFNPDVNTHEIVWQSEEPTFVEKCLLNKLMNDIASLVDFDIYEYYNLLDLKKESGQEGIAKKGLPDLTITEDVISECMQVHEVGVSYKRTFDITTRPQIKSGKHAIEVLRAVFDDDTIDLFETSYALFLNRKNKVMHVAKLCDGTGNSCYMDTRKILQIALNVNANSIIVAHNHPSGDTKPSQQDVRTTKNINDACKLFNMALLDHVILTRESYFAFSEDDDYSVYLYND